MSRNVRITLLCEDAQHETFAKKLLQTLGWQLRDFRIERSPSSRGSAEHFVRERFPIELRGLRSKRGEKRRRRVLTSLSMSRHSKTNRLATRKPRRSSRRSVCERRESSGNS